MTASELARLMRKRASRVEPEFAKTMNGVRISMVKYQKELMTAEIYAIPEDLKKSGVAKQRAGRRILGSDKKWRRTGHLRRSERADLTSPYTLELVNDANYGLPRHEAGKPGKRKVNPLRESHWRDEAVKLWLSIKDDLLQATIRDILNTK